MSEIGEAGKLGAEKRESYSDPIAKYKGRMMALTQQRDNAMNEVVAMAGQILEQSSEIEVLEQKITKLEKQLPAPVG